MHRVSWVAVLAAGCLALTACDSSRKLAAAAAPNCAPFVSGDSSDAWNAPVGEPVVGMTLTDGWTDLRVVPSPVNVCGGWTDSVAVTPDGLHLYFGYTRNGFTEFFRNFSTVVTGPLREGMTDPWFHIFRADLGPGGWTVHYPNVNTPQNGTTLFGQASASVNQTGDLMVFSQFDNTGLAILNYSTLVSGSWTTAVALPGASPIINSGCAGGGDDNGFVVGSLGTGVVLSWESHRLAVDGSTCGGGRHLYQATYAASAWSAIQAVPGLNDLVTVPNSDDSQVSFTPDGLTAYWTSQRMYLGTAAYGVFTADWDGVTSSYINVRPVARPTYPGPFAGKAVLVGEANVATTASGLLLYMMCGIANSDSIDVNGFPNDVSLKVCVARK
jgi:hypothetical protein